jgi:small GTP-binding protein
MVPDGQLLATAPSGKAIHIWDVKAKRQLAILEGHKEDCSSVTFSYDGLLLASKSLDSTVRLWRCDTWETVAVLSCEESSLHLSAGISFHPYLPLLATLDVRDVVIRIWSLELHELLGAIPEDSSFQYLNAKVVIVGEGGVGKSGLGIRIAEKEFRLTEATHGGQFWQIPVPRHVIEHTGLTNVQAELILWDLAGQPDYRLTHQLFLDGAHVALLLFNCADLDDPFRGVHYWAKVLKKQLPSEAVKFLVSARIDVNPVSIDQSRITDVLSTYELHAHISTCAKTGAGVNELAHRIVEAIPWTTLPRTARPRLFQVIRTYFLERKRNGDTFVILDVVPWAVSQRYTGHAVELEEIATVINLLERSGLVYCLESISGQARVLLRPELINQYGSSTIQGARKHSRGIGAILESEVLRAHFLIEGFQRLELGEERIVLEAAVEAFIKHDLAFREMGMLVFPSQINISRPEPSREHPPTEVTYRFSGSVEAIYASLVVRLSHTEYFQREDLWKYAIEFSRHGHRLGFIMREVEEGTCELDVYFAPDVNEFDRATFIRFITDHLGMKGIDIQEHISLNCPQCKRDLKDREAIETRVRARKLDIPCQYCGTSVLIPGSIEERYRSDESYSQKQQELVEKAEERTEQEIRAFRDDRRQYSKSMDHRINILHLSDIHIKTLDQAHIYRTQLEADLTRELGVHRLQYLVISGDIADRSTPEEYNAAYTFVDVLVKRFGLDANRVVVVPGNHDLNWDLSVDAYPFMPKWRLPENLRQELYIPGGDTGAFVRNEDLYRQRFSHFSMHFYKKLYTGLEYPPDYVDQTMLNPRPEDHSLFLTLNSSWEIDHHNTKRASINTGGLLNSTLAI